eukprot:TRINITY_DN10183_c0_g1_i2.p2 TRINITY_DN10183_c0_g1~~TRINITY_DN10183_c0_g1_i2.p2  ORF type:complete len:153 (-),score=25.72 TRINITY_DN10183_c0_g1_i2:191-649(-)
MLATLVLRRLVSNWLRARRTHDGSVLHGICMLMVRKRTLQELFRSRTKFPQTMERERHLSSQATSLERHLEATRLILNLNRAWRSTLKAKRHEWGSGESAQQVMLLEGFLRWKFARLTLVGIGDRSMPPLVDGENIVASTLSLLQLHDDSDH